RVVWTNGCFDLFHFGHLRTLQMARKYGDLLVVGVNSDEAVQRMKGPTRPVVPLPERLEIVAALECVDSVIAFAEPTPEAIIQQLRPDICCKGDDYTPPHGKPIPEATVIREYGGALVFLPLVPEWSTSSLIERIRTQSLPR